MRTGEHVTLHDKARLDEILSRGRSIDLLD